MKEVMAVIRLNRINDTKQALAKAGFPSLTALKAVGRGKEAVEFEIVQALNEHPSETSEVLPLLATGSRLLPKRLLSVVVPDDKVDRVVSTLIETNQTGTPGDGKIFVLPVEDSVRVSTGETAELAINEMKG
ncbi:P-II family nitrogen regulator [Phormidium sp. CCY1219]|uniref:P-II family nitrogen regulator n=1 Tax=Phormidium sp. CCY1219 TaxID=2886104 RepID=UPI002D1EE77D|nr:P-II family nitrogen regulator [Phormidium sp. CCY1219]MEB3827178.1 P-II family nitrogen regulator [Phormidium sp. CCY1219]